MADGDSRADLDDVDDDVERAQAARAPDQSSLHAIQRRCDSLVLKDDIDKTAALEILRQHHNLESFFHRMQEEKNSEIARLRHNLEMTRINGELRVQVSDIALQLADATRANVDLQQKLREVAERAEALTVRVETLETGFQQVELRSRGRR
jgi:hypothetical protein